MVNVVRAEALFYQLVCRQVPGKLMDNGCNNLKVGQLFRSNIGEGCLALLVRHGVALGQVTHGRAHLAVRAAVLAHYKLRHLSIGFFDINRELQSFFIYPHISTLLPMAMDH